MSGPLRTLNKTFEQARTVTSSRQPPCGGDWRAVCTSASKSIWKTGKISEVTVTVTTIMIVFLTYITSRMSKLYSKPDTVTVKTFPHPQGYSLMPDQAISPGLTFHTRRTKWCNVLNDLLLCQSKKTCFDCNNLPKSTIFLAIFLSQELLYVLLSWCMRLDIFPLSRRMIENPN